MVDHVTKKEDFAALLAGNEKVFVDFYAQWCGPCKAIAPKIEEWAREFKNIKVVKVDVDEAEALAAEYGIRAMPTFILFHHQKKFEEIVGANQAKVREAMQKLAAA